MLPLPQSAAHSSAAHRPSSYQRSLPYSSAADWPLSVCCHVQVDLFSYRRVFVPVHVHGNHWCLGCLDMDQRRISYYDSLGGSNDTFFSTMRQYLVDEYAAHHGPTSSCHHPPPPLPIQQWSQHCPKHIPRQDNGSDCGVFTLKFADYLSHSPAQHSQQQQQQPSTAPPSGEEQLDFSASDMEYFRHRIALEIKLQRVM